MSETEHVYEVHTPYSLSDWQKYLSHAEVDLLDALARWLPADPVAINIGAGSGLSALTLLTARGDLFLYTIDITFEMTVYGGLLSEAGILRAAGLLPTNRYVAIHGDSVKVGREWGNGPVDLVFIDGGHEYEECRGDIEAWWLHLKPGGFMAVHDYRKREAYAAQHPGEEITEHLLSYQIKEYPGVNRAVEELLTGKQEVVSVVDTLIAFRKAAA